MATFIDPFTEVRRMQRDINRLFNESFGTNVGGWGGFGGGMMGPSTFGPMASLAALGDVTAPAGSTALSVLPGVTDVALPADMSRDLAFVPRIDIHEEGNNLLVHAELPGLNKEDIKVEYDNGLLRLSGERKREREEKGENWYRQERSFGKFHRAFRLPHPVKQDQIQAKFENGVLNVCVPQEKPHVEHKGKAINVQ